MQHSEFCQTFDAAGSLNSENAHQNWNSSMKRMLSHQLNLVYSQINLLKINCEAKGQITCHSFAGKSMNGGISRWCERTKTEPKTTWSKDSSDYSGHFRLEKRLAL